MIDFLIRIRGAKIVPSLQLIKQEYYLEIRIRFSNITPPSEIALS